MTPQPQQNIIDKMMQEYDCIFYPMCVKARELLYCPKKVGKSDCEDYRSRPAPSPIRSMREDEDGHISWQQMNEKALAEHDAAIAAQAREKLFEAIRAERDPHLDYVDWDSIEAAKAREDVLEELDNLRKYAHVEFEEANTSDNEREMRIHLEYENRIWDLMKQLREQSQQGGERR